MGLLKFTKEYGAADNGSVVTGTDVATIQSDIASVLNGGVTNANIATSAGIVESKLTFDASAGHTHNGTDATYPLIKHYRRGMALKQGTDNEDIKVTPGVIDIGGKLLVSTADSANIDIVSGTWADGGSRPVSGPIYVYAYNNSGSVGFALSLEAPDLSDASGNTAEYPFRYQLYTAVYYRLIGIVHTDASSDLFPDMYNNFDLTNFTTGSFVATGADYTIYTGWTPDVIQWMVSSDSTPADNEALGAWGWIQKYGWTNANPQPKDLYFDVVTHQHQISADATTNTVFGITAQTAATTGSGRFSIDTPTSGQVVTWMAWSKGQAS